MKTFFSLYLGMLVVNLVRYFVNYEYMGFFDFNMGDFFSPIPYATIGAIVIYFVNKLKINSDDDSE